MFRIVNIAFLMLLILQFGCETGEYHIDRPAGFAEFTKDKEVYRAISSDGVQIRVYKFKNEPYGTSGMWMEAIDHYLKGNGYNKILKKEITASGNIKGRYVEYHFRYYGENYIYSLSLFTDKSDIYLVESGGIEKYFKKRRKSVVSAVEGFRISK